jgi:DNA polymerase III epsilon subunit-like protein
MIQEKKSSIHKNEVYISVDIEAAGPVPAEYSMLSIGACDVESPEKSFYIELKPINDHFIPEALAVSGFSLDHLKISGTEPAEGMGTFSKWIEDVAAGLLPVFVGFNAPFDWQFINWYFHVFLTKNPFGINAIDIKAYYMGFSGSAWVDTSSSRLPSWLQSPGRKRHNALEDAVAQAEIFAKLLSARRSNVNVEY